MFEFLWNLASFLISLGILVTVHEYGHYWVARKCGVKVLRFSVGFGKPLFRKVSKSGTEFVLATIPLGGYVKMLDERVMVVEESERHLSFNAKPVSSRIAIIAAGPLANFFFAIFALWLMYLAGVQSIKPVIGSIEPESVMARAGLQPGDQLLAIADEPVYDWRDITFSLMENMAKDNVALVIKSDEGIESKRVVDLTEWRLDQQIDSPLQSLGIVPFRPATTLTLAQIQKGSAANKAGLKPQDEIITVDGRSISSWSELVGIIQNAPNQTLLFEVVRGAEKVSLTVIPDNRPTKDGFSQGHLGVAPYSEPWPEDMIVTRQFGPIEALIQGTEKTWQLIRLSFSMIGNLISGQVSVKNLSGPVGIAQGAGASVSYGWVAFLSFLAFISVSLGVFNLLPLPILDGGHLMYYLIELIRKKPVSEKTQEFGFKIGAMVLLLLTSVALFNDFTRL